MATGYYATPNAQPAVKKPVESEVVQPGKPANTSALSALPNVPSQAQAPAPKPLPMVLPAQPSVSGWNGMSSQQLLQQNLANQANDPTLGGASTPPAGTWDGTRVLTNNAGVGNTATYQLQGADGLLSDISGQQAAGHTSLGPALQLPGAGASFGASGAGGAPMSAGMQSYGPGSDLRGTQINPSQSAQLSKTSGYLDSALQKLMSYNPGTFTGVNAGSYSPNADTERARALTMQGLEGAMGGPDRKALALDTMKLFDEQDAPRLEQDYRQVGQKAAALGRVGAGMTTNDLTDVFHQHDTARNQMQRSLAIDTAQQELSDRLNRLGAAQSVNGQFAGQDLSNAGFQQGLRNESRNERDSLNQFNMNNLSANQGILNSIFGVQQGLHGQGLSDRNELRGERDFQNNMSQQGINNAVQKELVQDQLQNSQHGRDQDWMNNVMNVGFGGQNYGNALNNNASQIDQNSASQNQMMQILAQYLAQNKKN